MKPEWPLYGLCALGGLLIGGADALFGWSEQTTSYIGAGALVAILWTYLPSIESRRDRRDPKPRSARG